ncbi:hypothetical protein Tco_1186341 [Tanacetum coccineum]
MSTLKFAESHNIVAFLAKPTESEGFEQIVDFLNVNPIKYALMVNPTIYTSCIEQFWATAKTSVRRDLQLEDAEGIECLPNADIFEQLALMSAKTTAWNEFSSTMASAIICLATDQKFNFSKYIFESMVKNVDSSVKFLMYPRKICTKLQQRVLDLENTKTAQAQEISSLKLRVKRLEKKGGSRTHKPKRLFKVGRYAQVVSSEDEGLGNQEDASKQGRKIDDINQDAEVTLVDETQGRAKVKKVVEEVVSTAEVSVVATITTEEITLAQALAELRSAKPKVMVQELVQSTTTTAPSTIPKAKSITFRDLGESTTRTTLTPTLTPIPSNIKGKGKAKMIEPEKPLKKKEQIRLDEKLAFKLQAE